MSLEFQVSGSPFCFFGKPARSIEASRLCPSLFLALEVLSLTAFSEIPSRRAASRVEQPLK